MNQISKVLWIIHHEVYNWSFLHLFIIYAELPSKVGFTHSFDGRSIHTQCLLCYIRQWRWDIFCSNFILWPYSVYVALSSREDSYTFVGPPFWSVCYFSLRKQANNGVGGGGGVVKVKRLRHMNPQIASCILTGIRRRPDQVHTRLKTIRRGTEKQGKLVFSYLRYCLKRKNLSFQFVWLFRGKDTCPVLFLSRPVKASFLRNSSNDIISMPWCSFPRASKWKKSSSPELYQREFPE